LRAPFKLAQAAIPTMRSQGRGWIVNIGSVTAQRPFKPYDDFARAGGATVYAAVKAALARFTQGLAAELERDDIAVNLVAPSTAISTPGADRFVPEGYPTEPVEILAEVVYEMCHRPAAERTGLLAHSLHYARALGLECRDLDRDSPLSLPEIPAHAHPEIPEKGE
jgi:NAD(P)-dependent dehydrogenase (short-subunit alcohol dehydrogenase family)